MPVCGTCRPAMPATCGSSSRISSRPESAHTREPVGPPAPLQLVQRRQPAGLGGDHDLAAALVRHAVLLAPGGT